MSKKTYQQKRAKLLVKAEAATTREEAQRIIKKARKLDKKQKRTV